MTTTGRRKRILLAGYYGFNNAGDEAVLAGLIKAFKSLDSVGDIDIAAHSIDPAATTKAHGIPAAHRYRPLSVLRSIAGADLFASGGGSLLQDATSAHSIFYYLATVRLAQMLGKKTMFIAQGIGPLTRPRSQNLTRSVANRLDAITVRDQDSADLLRHIGVTRPPITITADPALLLGPKQQARDRKGCAVALRPWRDHAAPLIGMLAAAYRRNLAGVPILPMAMLPKTDDPMVQALITRLADSGMPSTAPGASSLSQLLKSAATAEMAIGMRLHALIFAAAAATPAVAIAYDPKISAFMSQSGQEDAVFHLESDEERLSDIVGSVWSERLKRQEALVQRLPMLRANALRNARIAIEVVS